MSLHAILILSRWRTWLLLMLLPAVGQAHAGVGVELPTLVATLKGHKEAVRALAYSPDGKTLVSGSFDGTLKLWDVATRTERLTLNGHKADVLCVAYAPDGKIIASGSQD